MGTKIWTPGFRRIDIDPLMNPGDMLMPGSPYRRGLFWALSLVGNMAFSPSPSDPPQGSVIRTATAGNLFMTYKDWGPLVTCPYYCTFNAGGLLGAVWEVYYS